MITAQKLQTYVSDEPIRPFRISMASGQFLDIRHPEMISEGRTSAHTNFFFSDDPEQIKERVREVLIMFIESIEPLAAITSESRN